MCMCMCVCDRERERERGNKSKEDKREEGELVVAESRHLSLNCIIIPQHIPTIQPNT